VFELQTAATHKLRVLDYQGAVDHSLKCAAFVRTHIGANSPRLLYCRVLTGEILVNSRANVPLGRSYLAKAMREIRNHRATKVGKRWQEKRHS
jgi:hypothetical protein